MDCRLFIDRNDNSMATEIEGIKVIERNLFISGEERNYTNRNLEYFHLRTCVLGHLCCAVVIVKMRKEWMCNIWIRSGVC